MRASCCCGNRMRPVKGRTAQSLMPQEPVDQNLVSAEEAVVLAEQSRDLRRSLSQLPETNRQILEHCYFQGLTL